MTGLALSAAIVIASTKGVRATAECSDGEQLVDGACRKVIYEKVTHIDFETDTKITGDLEDWMFDVAEDDEFFFDDELARQIEFKQSAKDITTEEIDGTGDGTGDDTGDTSAGSPDDSESGGVRKPLIKPHLALIVEHPSPTFKCDEFLYKIKKMKVDGEVYELKKLRKSLRARNKFRVCNGMFPEQWEKWGRSRGYLPEPVADPDLAWLFEDDAVESTQASDRKEAKKFNPFPAGLLYGTEARDAR